MPLFTKNKRVCVQGFILKVVNNNCPELKALIEGPRLDRRVNLTIVVLVIPIERGELCVDRAFTAVTKEFSNNGVAVVLSEPRGLDEVLLGFRWEGEMTFMRAKAKHLNPMGGGFYQIGFHMTDMACAGDYPELQSVSF
jgi:hypothetical protein